MRKETIDFISETDKVFQSEPISMTDEESVDLYYINRLFQYEPAFRMYILTALGVYMDTLSQEKDANISLTEERINLTNELFTKITSENILHRLANHSANLAKILAEKKES